MAQADQKNTGAVPCHVAPCQDVWNIFQMQHMAPALRDVVQLLCSAGDWESCMRPLQQGHGATATSTWSVCYFNKCREVPVAAGGHEVMRGLSTHEALVSGALSKL